jgi:hypothetical protein
MAMKPKPLTLTNRAAQSLQGTNHSVFNPDTLVIKTTDGKPMPTNWGGPAMTQFKLAAPTTVTRAWRAYFYSDDSLPGSAVNYMYKCYTFLPAELTEVEAHDVARTLMDMVNLRRRGA